jgi:hypothetical protein
MTDNSQLPPSPSRRHILKVGAIAAPAVLTLRPGQAWAASLTCQVQIPYITTAPGGGAPYTFLAIGELPAANIPADQIVAPPINGLYTATQLNGSQVTNPAHLAYLAQLSSGTPGFSCLQSIGFTVR